MQADATVQKLQQQLLTPCQAAACHLAWLQHEAHMGRERAKLWLQPSASEAAASAASEQPEQRSPKRLRLSPSAAGDSFLLSNDALQMHTRITNHQNLLGHSYMGLSDKSNLVSMLLIRGSRLAF